MDMTSPSSTSYVFYDENQNPNGERTEGVKLARVVISDTKITRYSKQILKTDKSGTLYEKATAKQEFSLHTNRNGEKYLKSFSLGHNGFVDNSLDMYKDSDKSLDVSNITNGECSRLVRATIVGWFGSEYISQHFNKCRGEMLFPALRDKTFPRNPEMVRVLTELQSSSYPVTKALRENNSWDSFIADICKPTVKTDRDVSLVKQRPEALLPIAVMDLGSPFSTLYPSTSRNWVTVLMLSKAFDGLDLNYIRFMFKNLPQVEKAKAWQTLFNLTDLHERNKLKQASFHRYHYVDPHVDLSSIPVALRSELARTLAKQLAKAYKLLKAGSSSVLLDSHVTTGLNNSCRRWFAKHVLAPQMKTKTTIEDLQNRLAELLGTELHQPKTPLKFIKAGKTVFCLMSDPNTFLFVLSGQSEFNPNVFRVLENMASNNRPKGRGARDLNGYIYGDELVTLTGRVYSLDDMMNIIEKGVNETDLMLDKLGRQITPENRLAFLKMGSQRKFKNTWRLYDWGVTDPHRISTLKKSQVMKKSDVQTYNELPDEMFYELLALEAGETSGNMSFRSEPGLLDPFKGIST